MIDSNKEREMYWNVHLLSVTLPVQSIFPAGWVFQECVTFPSKTMTPLTTFPVGLTLLKYWSLSYQDGMVVFHLASVMSGQGERDFDICWQESWIHELILHQKNRSLPYSRRSTKWPCANCKLLNPTGWTWDSSRVIGEIKIKIVHEIRGLNFTTCQTGKKR